MRGGVPERLAVAVDGPRRAELEAALRQGTAGGPRSTIRSPPGPTGRRALEHRGPAARPRAADRHDDALRHARLPRAATEPTTRFAKVLSGRVALALDNAGLFAEVETLEAQQAAALGSLAEAVTVQDRRGRLVYANEAAARALGFPSADALLATPREELVDAFDAFHEDGSPLDMARLPGRARARGRASRAAARPRVHRAHGEERWRLTKASAVRDRDGRPRLAVNVIEDVTERSGRSCAIGFLAAGRRGARVLARLRGDAASASRSSPCPRSPTGAGSACRTIAADSARSPSRTSTPPRSRSRASTTAVPDLHRRPSGAAQVLRDGRPQLVNEIPDELLEQAVADPEQLAAGARDRHALGR